MEQLTVMHCFTLEHGIQLAVPFMACIYKKTKLAWNLLHIIER